MAQSIPSFVQTRFPEPLASRATDADTAPSGEGEASFGAHLAAERPAQAASSNVPRRVARHANRDIEDTKREAARDVAPVVARPQATLAEASRPTRPVQNTPDEDHRHCGTASPGNTGENIEKAACDKPDRPPVAKPAAGNAEPVKAVCEHDDPVDAPVIAEGGTPLELNPETGSTGAPKTPPTSGNFMEIGIEICVSDAPIVDVTTGLTVAGEIAAPAGAEASIAHNPGAPTQSLPSAAALVLLPVTPASTETIAATDEIAASGIVGLEAAPKSLTSVPAVGGRDLITGEIAAQLAKLDGAEKPDEASVATPIPGDKKPAKGEIPEIKASAFASDGNLRPREGAPSHAFADWVNEFAQAQGAIHRSGDLVGSLDRAIAGQAPSAGGADALRPTPLQVLPIEIGMQAARGATRFQIRLDPAELGRVDVQLDIQDNGEVRASLVVDRVETLAILKRDAHTLQYAFEQAGLKQATDGLSFSLRGEGQNNPNAQREGGHPRHHGKDAEPTSVPNAQIAEFAMRRVMIPHSSIDRVV